MSDTAAKFDSETKPRAETEPRADTGSAGNMPGSGHTLNQDPRRQAPEQPPAMSVTDLFRKLIHDVGYLFRKELALATSEIVDSVEEARTGVVGMIGGAAIFYGGILCMLGAAALALSNYLQPWAATLLVGAAAAVIGFIIIQTGKRKLSPRAYRPERTEEAIRRDGDMIRRQAKS